MAGPKQKSPETGNIKPVSDPSYNLVSVLYHALKGADLYSQYITDAEAAGDTELRDFFVSVRSEDSKRAHHARRLLIGRSQLETTEDWQVGGAGAKEFGTKRTDVTPEAE